MGKLGDFKFINKELAHFRQIVYGASISSYICTSELIGLKSLSFVTSKLSGFEVGQKSPCITNVKLDSF